MSGRLIPSNPVLTPTLLKRRRSPTFPPPLDRPSTQFFAYGRAALLAGLKMLDLRPDDNILVPSLICRAVVDPLAALGVEARFYSVGDHLEPDFETAAHLVDRQTRAFLAVHYFGYPQAIPPILEFCEANRLRFIEDNAHGFLSAIDDRPLGTFGDIAIFSFRKTLPIPDGAALVVNCEGLPPPAHDQVEASQLQRSRHYGTFVLRNLLRNLEATLGVSLVSRLKFVKRRFSGPTHDDEAGSEPLLADGLTSWSAPSRRILEHLDLERVKAARIEAFKFWEAQDMGNDATGVFRSLPRGTVPYAFPLRVSDQKAQIRTMANRGVECFSWPDLPAESPERHLANRLVAVPLHEAPRWA